MRGLRLRPEQKGIRATLFDLESDVMEVIWSQGGWQSVADVHASLARSRDIAYTTVLTTVARLHKKEILARRRDGRRHLYRAELGREELAQRLAAEVLDSLDEVSGDVAVALLVDRVARADEAELARIERVIRARRAPKRSR